MLQLIVILSAHRTYTSAFLRLPSADFTFMPVSEGERSVLQATVPRWPSRSFRGQRRLFATLQELALRLSKSSVAPEVRPNSLLHRSKTCKACEAAACLTGSSLADCSLAFLEAALRAGHASVGYECWGVPFSEAASHLGPNSRQNVLVISDFSGVLKPAPCIYLL